MDKLVGKVSELYTKYKDNDIIISKLNFYVTKQLPALLDKFNEQEKKKEILQQESDKYINEFLLNPIEQYFYIPATDIFVKYDSKSYTYITEDDFWYIILNDITNHNDEKTNLNGYKQKTKNKIIEEVKKKSIFKTIPESYTVQLVINFFTPTIFNTKEDVKHFMALIGDNILGKKHEINYLMPIGSKPFFDALESLSEYYFQSKMNIQNCLRFRYRGQDFNNCRLIYFTKSIRNKSCWISFLKENFLNFIVVCCHYSTRYVSADNYANKQTKTFKNKIFYLKDHNKNDVVNEFINNMFVEDNNSTIKWEDIYFLWKFYIKMKNMPNMIYKADFETIIRSKLNHDNNTFYNIKSNYLTNVEYFKTFCDEYIETDTEDLLEISELYNLLISWLDGKEYSNFLEDDVKDMIEYFYRDITIENDKFLLGVKCKLWDKQRDILESFEKKFNKTIEKDITIYDAYVMYCKYSNNNGKILTVSKSYFYKYIDQIIPSQYIINNKISISYWSS